MTTSNFRVSVHTSSDSSSPPTSFSVYNLDMGLYCWFQHARASASDPQPLLAHLLAFLQNTSFTFSIVSNVDPTDHPQGSLQLLSLAYNPPAINKLKWVHSDIPPSSEYLETANLPLSPMAEDEFSLIFRSTDNQIVVWHSYHEFHIKVSAQDTDSSPSIQHPWQDLGVSSLQLRQSLTNLPPPVIPAYLCETLRFEDSQATFIIGNEKPLTTVVPLHIPLPTLLRLFANQPALCALLNTLDSSFEVAVAYGSQCPCPQTRACDLRITALDSYGSLFVVTSSFNTAVNPLEVRPFVLTHMKNFLSSFFQWQTARHFVLAYGYHLRPDSGRWKLISNASPEPVGYFYWIGSAPGGYVEILSTPPLEYRFGASEDPSHTPEILPPPLDALSAVWVPLQAHMQNLQLAQLQC